MTFFYAQIDVTGVAVSVSQAAAQINAANMIPLSSYDLSVLGQRWGGQGWHDVPVPPQPLVPHKVTRRQARQALLLAGLLEQVEPAIQSITDPMQRQLALIEWQDSLEFERHRPLLITLGAALGLDEAALDQLFITAATL